MTELPGDVPAAAGSAGSGSPRRRELVPVPARARRLARLPAAVVSGARGLDARLRRRRPGRRSPTSSAAQEAFDALVEAVRERGPGDRARHRPQPHGDRRRQPLLGRSGSCATKFFDLDEVTGRHRRFFDVDHLAGAAPGGPGGLRGHARAGAAARARGRRRRAADRSPGRARRPGGLPRAAARRRRRARVGGEDPRPRRARCATGRSTGTVGYEFLNDVCGAVRRPRGRGAADRPVGRGLRRRPALRRATPSRPSSSRRGRRSRPEVERLLRDAPVAGDRARARAGVVPGLPHLRRAVVGARRGRRPRGDRRGRPADVAGARARARDARLGRVRHALPADDAAGDGQGRRGHRVLPLRAAAGAERRRRRPGAVLAARSTTSTRPTASARSASRATCSSPRRTTPSAPATCARGSARWPGWPTSSPRTCGRWLNACRSLTSGGAPTPVEQHFIFQTLLGVWPISEDRLAQLPREGDARGQAAHDLGRPSTRPTRRPSSPSRARCSPTATSCATSSPSSARVAEAGDRAALGQLLLKLTVPGVPDIYQGDELLLPLARGPGQPPRGRLGRAPRRAGRPAAEARPDPARAGAAGRAARGRSPGPTSRCRPARTRSRSCAAARSSRARCCAATPVELTLPPGDWRDVLAERDRLRDPHARRHRAAQAAGDRALPDELPCG